MYFTVPVGTPIMITVEDPADVSAFKDYVVPATAPVAVAPVVVEKASSPAPVVATPPPPPPPVAATTAAATPVVKATPTPPPTPIPAPVPNAASTVSTSNSFSTAIPGITYMNTKKSPLTYTLNTEQTKYINLYGTTGQSPIS